MKPIFCVDITSDKSNETVNGAEFITRSVTKQKLENYETKVENLEQTIEKSRLPLWLRIVKYLCGILSLMILAATIRAGFDTAMRNAPFLVLSGFFCGILWLVLQFAAKKKEKKVLAEDHAEQQSDEIEVDTNAIREELEVPQDALDVDVLLFRYKTKGEKITPHAQALQTTVYINLPVKLYATDEEIHLADLEAVYSFKKSELKAITTVNKRIGVPNWNKEEDPRRGEYKPYKMGVNNMGDIFFKPYYILEIERDGQQYGIYFPCYELKFFESLTGMTATPPANSKK